jgi:hypothetical protein
MKGSGIYGTWELNATIIESVAGRTRNVFGIRQGVSEHAEKKKTRRVTTGFSLRAEDYREALGFRDLG